MKPSEPFDYTTKQIIVFLILCMFGGFGAALLSVHFSLSICSRLILAFVVGAACIELSKMIIPGKK